MAVYLIGDIKVTNSDWLPDYAANVHDIVHRHGGRFLTRSNNVKVIQGKQETGTMIAIIEFPEEEAVHAFLNDPDYAEHSTARSAGSESRVLIVDKSDFVDSIPYLKQ